MTDNIMNKRVPARRMLFFDLLIADPNLKLNDVRVAWALLSHYNDKTGECYPSLARLAGRLSVNEKTVRRASTRLIERRYFSKRPRARGGVQYDPNFSIWTDDFSETADPRTVGATHPDNYSTTSGQRMSNKPIEPNKPSSLDKNDCLVNEDVQLGRNESEEQRSPSIERRIAEVLWQEHEPELRQIFGDRDFEHRVELAYPVRDDGNSLKLILSTKLLRDIWLRDYSEIVAKVVGRKIEVEVSRSAGRLITERLETHQMDRGEYVQKEKNPNIRITGEIEGSTE